MYYTILSSLHRTNFWKQFCLVEEAETIGNDLNSESIFIFKKFYGDQAIFFSVKASQFSKCHQNESIYYQLNLNRDLTVILKVKYS